MDSRAAEAQSKADLGGLMTALNHRFREPELLARALTHSSLANDLAAGTGEDRPAGAGDNERLEFLGDAVVGLVVAEALFKMHPNWSEGEMTMVRAQLVSRQHMAKVAAAIDLGSYLLLSKGEDRAGLRRASKVLSNTMEAVLGALYLDGGLEPVRIFVRQYLMGAAADQLAEELNAGEAMGNYKSALQEQLQSRGAGMPVYKVKAESGPDHRKHFLVEVRLQPSEGGPGKSLARGTGRSKKHAEQDAARRALAKLSAADAKAASQPVEPKGSEEEEIREQ
jgi:ribonuclease III